MRNMLRCKIHGGIVTKSDIDYEGSCGLGPDLLKESGILPFEKISVLNVSNGKRVETYVIKEIKDREITLNGAAAHFFKKGDKVIILNWKICGESCIKKHKAKIIILDNKNSIKKKMTKELGDE
tara:strand:- start:4102 stop:4473 length:372 start_codon:yes stop_codon:yes gene_type:complete